MIRVLLVDDHEMVRIGVGSFLSTQEDIEVVGEASNGLEGHQLALTLKPDVILMDLVMDIMDGIDATKKIIADWPQAKIIIVTSFIDDAKVFPALDAGAMSYVLKTSSAYDVAQAIRETAIGKRVLGKEVSEKLHISKIRHELHDDLTQREKEVLLLIAQGYSNQEISDTLFIALKTVKSHVSNILSKLDIEDRTQAAIYAYKKGMIK